MPMDAVTYVRDKKHALRGMLLALFGWKTKLSGVRFRRPYPCPTLEYRLTSVAQQLLRS